MEIRAITVNATGAMAAEQGIQGNGSPGTNQLQTENGNVFGPECKVTISRKGKDLSKQQTAQAETGVRDTQSVKEERMLLRRQEEAELEKDIREGYREELNKIEKQLAGCSTSYARMERNKKVCDAALMNKTIDEEQELMKAMRSQKQFQTEEGQRRAREAQQMATQLSQGQEEIDENNRDLLTLLKTMEEAEKTEDEQENGGAKSEVSRTSATGTSAGDIIRNSATQFMTSAVNREAGVEELLDTIDESGHWFLNTSNSITRNILTETKNIRAALDDKAFTDENITEMMQLLQDGMGLNYDNVKNFRSFGMKVQRDVREVKIQHIADASLKDVQETKESMMLSATSAAMGEARQSSLDKASQELADEVQELIDKRNDVDRIRQDREEDEEKQAQLQAQDGMLQTDVQEGKSL